MKKMTLVSLKLCLILVILLVISAATLADIALETNTKAEQHFEKANELLKRMEYEAAIAEYSKVVNLLSSSKIAQDAQYWIGQSQFRAGQFDAAQSTFAKLIEQYPASAIVPVTKLMVGRVEQAKKNEEKRRVMSDAADKGFIIDPSTGVKYTKVATFAGKSDVIEFTNFLNLSPNGRFLLSEKRVVPLDGSEPFDLVDISANRSTWSPDGTKVTFYSGDAICVVPVSPETGRPTGPVRKLLNGKYQFQPSIKWSPDGENFAFTREDDEVSGDIWTLSVTDGALTQITDDPLPEYGPVWSPDGKSIAYAKGFRSIWVSSAEGRKSRMIIDPGRTSSPSWSPDGQWILYTLRGKIHFFDLNDKKELEIIPSSEVGGFFSWSPDGKKMLFYRPSYDYLSTLKVVSASGGPSVELGQRIPLWPYGQWWSPDSRTIIVEGEDAKGDHALWIVPLSGGKPVPLEIDFQVDAKPIPYSLSPQWNKVVFGVKKSDGAEDYWVAPVSMTEARTTGAAVMVFKGRHSGRGGVYARSWSSDGSKIVISHEGDIWIAKSKGGTPVQITKTPEVEGWPRWSDDGKKVYYIIQSGKENTVYAIPASGGEPTKVLDNFYDAAWHPDGSGFAVASKDGHIKVGPTVGGEMRVIADLKDVGLKDVHDICLSPDGKHVACIGRRHDKSYSGPIIMVNVDDRNVTKLATDDKASKYWLSWSPDGKWISYNSDGYVKMCPEGTMWEADFEEIVKKASR